MGAVPPTLFDRICRNPRTGRLAIMQVPNPPLTIFLVVALARRLINPDGAVRAGLIAVGTVALVWWCVGEIVAGDSLFRRVLGGAVLFATLLNLVQSH